MNNITDQLNISDLMQSSNLESTSYEQAPTFEIGDEDYEYDYSSSDYDSDYEDDHSIKLRNAQIQWEHSVQQIKTLVGFVIFPLIGKILGRRFAGFLWRKAFDWLY